MRADAIIEEGRVVVRSEVVLLWSLAQLRATHSVGDAA